MLTGNNWLDQLYRSQFNAYVDLIKWFYGKTIIDSVQVLERPVPLQFLQHMLTHT